MKMDGEIDAMNKIYMSTRWEIQDIFDVSLNFEDDSASWAMKRVTIL